MIKKAELDELSIESKEVVNSALRYVRSGVPLQTGHIISDLVRRIQELEYDHDPAT